MSEPTPTPAATTPPATLRLVLAHCSNPDIPGGYWSGRPTGGRRQVVEVASLQEASKALCAWRDRLGLGGGNLARDCGEVSRDGAVIARVSYNGRVWEPGEFPTKEIAI